MISMPTGGYTRRRPSGTEKSTALSGIVLLIPAFLCIGYANGATLLYLGLLQFGYGEYNARFQVMLVFNYP